MICGHISMLPSEPTSWSTSTTAPKLLKEFQVGWDEHQNMSKVLLKYNYQHPSVIGHDGAKTGTVTCPGQPAESVSGTDLPFPISHSLPATPLCGWMFWRRVKNSIKHQKQGFSSYAVLWSTHVLMHLYNSAEILQRRHSPGAENLPMHGLYDTSVLHTQPNCFQFSQSRAPHCSIATCH